MKMSKRLTVAVLGVILGVCMAFGLAACGPKLEPLEVTSVTPATANVLVGATTTLRAKTNRDLVEGEVITWTSSSETIAKVDANGKVTGVAEGDATITAAYGESSATAKITVQLKREISLDKESAILDLDKSQSTTLTATCKKGGDEVSGATVTWKSSDDSIATVVNGVVTPVAKGNVTITATYEGVSASCEISVISYSAPYQVNEGSSNAIVSKDPGIWYYFAKTSSGINTYEGIDINRTLEETGEKVVAKFDKIATNEGADPTKQELYLRFMPTYEVGTVYTVTFKFTSTHAGTLEIGSNKFEYEANTEIEVVAVQTVTEKIPLNVKLFVVGENVELTLTSISMAEGGEITPPEAE